MASIQKFQIGSKEDPNSSQNCVSSLCRNGVQKLNLTVTAIDRDIALLSHPLTICTKSELFGRIVPAS